MPGLTPKQEAFAMAVASGLTQADAYRSAYNASKMLPATVQNKAHVLMKNGEISARVRELRKPIAEKAQITLEGHLAELEALRIAAKKARQFSAAITAEIARGKASGVHVEQTKSEQTVKGHLEIIERPKISKEEWMKAHRVGME